MEDFIREKIKEKPLNKKKIMVRLGVSALCGLVFAIVACIVFVIFFSVMYKQNQGGKIVLVDNDSETEMVTETQTEAITETQTQDTQEPEAQPQPTEIKEFTLEDYQKIQSQLYSIGSEANKSIVSITSVKSDTDWFNNTYDSVGTSAGVIVSESDKAVYILTEKKAISDASKIRVTFINEDSADAKMYQYDGNTGIAILSVEKESLEDVTLRMIHMAQFANSNLVSKGAITIALGSPLGTNYSILAGTITSTDNEITTLDRNYRVFTTDIVSTANGSGILINTEGEVIGLVMQDYSARDNENTLTAIGIRELEPIINLLLQGKQIPYIGMNVTTVSDKISREYDLPKGVYIREATVDSPGMLAGLQSGDVITKVDGEEVQTVSEYYDEVLKLDLEEEYIIAVMREGNSGYSEVKCKVKPGVLK